MMEAALVVVVPVALGIGVNNLIVYKDKIPKNIKKVKVSPKLKHSFFLIDYDEIVKKKYPTIILEFIDKITENFQKEDLVNFYNNINDVKVFKIAKDDKKYLKDKVNGSYSVLKNRILVRDGKQFETLYHELFHLATSVDNKDVIYSGFEQQSFSFMIGTGLNEGYTRLMTNRYFENTRKEGIEVSSYFASLLEIVIGEKEMQRAYLRADLNYVINELRKYQSDKEIMRFLGNLDFLYKHVADNTEDMASFHESVVKNTLRSVSLFLVNCYVKKTHDLFLHKKVNKDQEKDMIANYGHMVRKKIYSSGHSYDFMTDEDIADEIVTGLMDSYDMTGMPVPLIPLSEQRKSAR